MKAMVVYDSAYGNTEKIAQAIGNAIGSSEEVQVIRADDVQPEQLTGLALLVVGSPTQRFRPTAPVKDFMKRIPSDSLKGVKVAAFDTRLAERDINAHRVLAFFVRLFGYAARPISDGLAKKGGNPVVAPEGFYVAGMEGPLLEMELERAMGWAKQVAATK